MPKSLCTGANGLLGHSCFDLLTGFLEAIFSFNLIFLAESVSDLFALSLISRSSAEEFLFFCPGSPR